MPLLSHGAGLPDLDHLANLHARDARERSGEYFVEGVRFVHSALRHARAEILGLVHAPDRLSGAATRRLVRRIERAGIPSLRVDAAAYDDRLRRTEWAEPVGLWMRQNWRPLPRPPRDRPGLWLCFDRVRSPGNLGSTLRTAVAAGATGAIFLGPGADPYDPATVRSTMGAHFQLHYARVHPRHLQQWAKRTRTIVIGTSPGARTDFRAVSYRKTTVLMIGGERKGMSPRQSALCHREVRIPMVGRIDSLNLASATSLLLYEAFRQRRPPR